MKSVKRVLGLILVSMMLLTVIIPASADSALDGVTRAALTMGVGGNDATFAGEKLNLNFPGVTFTSSDNAVINATTGAVTRPQQAKNVTLTATAGSETKDFAFRIPGLFDNTPVESVVYYDDFEDGVLSSHIERTDYSKFTNETMEANGILQFQRPTGGSNAVTGRVWLKEDKTMTTGDVHMEFQVKRDFVYDAGFRVLFYGLDGSGNRVKAIEVDVLQGDATNWNTPLYIYTGTTAAVETETRYTIGSPNSYKFAVDVDGETGKMDLSINGTAITLNGGYLLSNFKGLACVGIMAMADTTDPWMEYFSCTQQKEASTEKVLYYDDFEDGVLDSRIVKADYSQETMEANGKLNFKSTGTGGDLGSNSHATGTVYFKEDQTAVDGKFKVEFELKRDAFVYGKTRIYFTGSDGYCHYIDWCGGVPNTDYSAWTTQIRLTTNGAVADDVLNTSAYQYVGTLKVEALIDNDAGTMELTLNGEKFNMNYCGEVSGRKVSCISISEYHTSADIVMNYINCTKDIEKEAVTATSMDYNAFDKKVTVVSPAAKSATVIAASYSGTEGNATLISAVPVPATLAEGGSVTVDTSALDISGASFIKLYLWDSTTGLKPLVASAYVSDVTAN